MLHYFLFSFLIVQLKLKNYPPGQRRFLEYGGTPEVWFVKEKKIIFSWKGFGHFLLSATTDIKTITLKCKIAKGFGCNKIVEECLSIFKDYLVPFWQNDFLILHVNSYIRKMSFRDKNLIFMVNLGPHYIYNWLQILFLDFTLAEFNREFDFNGFENKIERLNKNAEGNFWFCLSHGTQFLTDFLALVFPVWTFLLILP